MQVQMFKLRFVIVAPMRAIYQLICHRTRLVTIFQCKNWTKCLKQISVENDQRSGELPIEREEIGSHVKFSEMQAIRWTSSQKNVIVVIFWDCEGILLLDFKLRDNIGVKHPEKLKRLHIIDHAKKKDRFSCN